MGYGPKQNTNQDKRIKKKLKHKVTKTKVKI